MLTVKYINLAVQKELGDASVSILSRCVSWDLRKWNEMGEIRSCELANQKTRIHAEIVYQLIARIL